jgi:sugar-specific transcriptional regulator TrmB
VCNELSSDKILRVLTQLGFPKTEASVYLFLSIRGPKKIEELSSELKMPAIEIQNALKRLQERGFVSSTTISFFALPFERMMDTLAKSRLEEAQDIAEKKNTILSQWRSLVSRNTD